MEIGGIPLGEGAPLALIAGLNVIETEEATLDAAGQLRSLAEAHGLPLIFKASYDKANRSSVDSYRGPGLDAGIRILDRVKRELRLPILTDVHDPNQVKVAAGVADALADSRLPVAPDRPDRGLRPDRASGEHQEGPVHGPVRRGRWRSRRWPASGAEACSSPNAAPPSATTSSW